MDTRLIVWSNVHTFNTSFTGKILMTKMECHISDGPQEPEDTQDRHERDDPTDAERDEWINDRDENGTCTDPYELKEIAAEMDPTPWCHWCGAAESDQCSCGPIAENH
jgi:hypothetical protein